MFTGGILPVAIAVRSLHSNTDGVSCERAKWGVNSCYVCVKAGATESTSWSGLALLKKKRKLQATRFLRTGPVSDGRVKLIYRSARAPFFFLISPLSVSVLQMDPVQKAVLHHTLGIPPTAKRRHVSCSVCQLRFNSQVSKFSFERGGKSSEVTTILPMKSHSIRAGYIFQTKTSFCTGICGPLRGWILN